MDKGRHLLRSAGEVLGARIVLRDFLDGVASVQARGSFDDGWRGAIASALPSGIVRCLLERNTQHLLQKLAEPVCRNQCGIGHPICRSHFTALQPTPGASDHQHRPYNPMVAGGMEVLQVERVVPDLLDVRTLEVCRARLELKHEHHATKQQHAVDALAQARHHKFQEDFAQTERRQQLTQQSNLLLPGVALKEIDRELTRCGQRAEHALFVASQEAGNRAGVVSPSQFHGRRTPSK